MFPRGRYLDRLAFQKLPYDDMKLRSLLNLQVLHHIVLVLPRHILLSFSRLPAMYREYLLRLKFLAASKFKLATTLYQ